MSVLRGERVDRPPLWEPWFAMHRALRDRYAGDFVALADDLGHAAWPLPTPEVGTLFLAAGDRTEAGAFYHGGALRSPEQLRDRPEPNYQGELERLAAVRRVLADAGIACWLTLGWCFDRVAASMGLEAFAMACYDRPEFVHEAMEWVERRNRRVVENIVSELRPDFLLYNGDCAYKTGPMVAPEMLRRFCFEPSRRTAATVHDLGIPLAFHTDGRLDEILPILLDLGIAAVHGCEKQANDLSHLVEVFGDRIALAGNMDVVFLTQASVKQVVSETRRMLATGSRKHRFLAGCNTSPMDYVPWRNYEAMCRTIAAWPAVPTLADEPPRAEHSR